ncbi:hypothetical protein EIP75_00675 [Aquabacterium soli]|jgi:hypothetical protein|uniref:DUF5625 domain-containing protein n=1 Tax=Aquabacterium soli TaxID=2493092 RepID=A0A426VH48_9BURK|nr:DUF5625 family protein [Aquabacterium soli]RRS06149.1 hypothetical protein EIP75_00675 [Aquabacterium soli]
MSKPRTPGLPGIGRRVLAALFIGGASSGCVNGAGLQHPPFQLPVDMSHAQTVVEAEFEIREETFYAFNLLYPFKEGDAAGRAQAVRLAGAPFLNPATGRWEEPGAGIDVHLSVIALAADGGQDRTVHDSEIERPRKTSATADKLVSRLASVKLAPGRFKVRLVNRHDAPQYRDAGTQFSVVRAYMGK